MAEFTIEKPKLWWPKGMGDQHIYSLKAKLKLHIKAGIKYHIQLPVGQVLRIINIAIGIPKKGQITTR